MLNENLFPPSVDVEAPHKEGELYKTVEIQGKIFELYYGYYEARDRNNPLSEPMPIYPDFLKEPYYTDGGVPVVTMMQDACENYEGDETEDIDCSRCRYFVHCAELFGICKCEKNRLKNKS